MHIFHKHRPKLKEPLPSQGKGEVQTVMILEKEIELKSVIGEGQFGKVYKGKCRGGPVAIKRINLLKSDLSELMAEIQILAAERHNNIVLLLGVCDCESGELMIVTELCSRGDLRKLLESGTALSLRRKIQFAVDIATGMAWMAEGCGEIAILHRDLKPANVLVTQDWQCKIADFGLANLKRKKKTYKDSEFLPGSLPYMAPEVFESKDLTSALDVYSYGIVLYEMYTRETRWYHPIEKNFEEEVVRDHKRPPIAKIQEEEYAKLVQRCWHHDPNHRPTFTAIPTELQHMRINIFLKKFPNYHALWTRQWLAEDQVPFKEFSDALFRYCDVACSRTRVSLVRKLACPLIVEDHQMTECGEDAVNIEHLQHLLLWFPTRPNENLIDAMCRLCGHPWFFGLISSSEAKQRLSGTPEATFLVRLNTGKKASVEEAPYVLTRVDPWKKEIRHTYIQSEGSGKLLARVYVDAEHRSKMQEIRGASLTEILPRIASVRVLKDGKEVPLVDPICPGFPFADFFENRLNQSSGYDPYRPKKSQSSSDSLD